MEEEDDIREVEKDVGANQWWTPSYAAHLRSRSKDLLGIRDRIHSMEMILRVAMYKTRIHTHTTIHINTKNVFIVSLSFSHNTINICLHNLCTLASP